jgi:hypothetical protein
MSNSSFRLPSAVRRDRDRPGRGIWRDILIGAGLAFDPLPSGPAEPLLNDRDAFAADLRKLAQDRHTAMQRLGVSTSPETTASSADSGSLVIYPDGSFGVVFGEAPGGAIVIGAVGRGISAKTEHGRDKVG